MSQHDLQFLAEDVICAPCETAAAAQALAKTLRDTGEWVDVVPGLDSVAAQFDPVRTSPEQAASRLKRAIKAAPERLSPSNKVLIVPARYGGEYGPDLARICNQIGLEIPEFIYRHSAKTYPVDMIGFTPGFAYLGGLDPLLSVPRLVTPEARVSAGSIGISGLFTGIYALSGPGGWPIIARTDMSLFDAKKNDPFTMRPGLKIRFIPQ